MVQIRVGDGDKRQVGGIEHGAQVTEEVIDPGGKRGIDKEWTLSADNDGVDVPNRISNLRRLAKNVYGIRNGESRHRSFGVEGTTWESATGQARTGCAERNASSRSCMR